MNKTNEKKNKKVSSELILYRKKKQRIKIKKSRFRKQNRK